MPDIPRIIKRNAQDRFGLISALQCVVDRIDEGDLDSAKAELNRAYLNARRVRSNFEELYGLYQGLTNDIQNAEEAYADGWRDGLRDYWIQLTPDERKEKWDMIQAVIRSVIV